MRVLLFLSLLCLIAYTAYAQQQQCAAANQISLCNDVTCGFQTPALFPNNTGCKPCSKEDIGTFFTDCDAVSNTKSMVYFWRPPATCQPTNPAWSTLPLAVSGVACNLVCQPGTVFNPNSKACDQCAGGSFSNNHVIYYDNWGNSERDWPDKQLVTRCERDSPSSGFRNCPSWRVRGDYIDSGQNDFQLGLRSSLRYSVEVTGSNSYVKFRYNYFTDNAAVDRFEVIINGNVAASLQDTSNITKSETEWIELTIPLQQGYNEIEWLVTRGYDQYRTNMARIFMLEIASTRKVDTKCKECPAGTYAAPGSKFCQACPPNTYSDAGASQCTPCPQYQTSTRGSATCTPNPFVVCTPSDIMTDYTACSRGSRYRLQTYIQPRLCDPSHPNSTQLAAPKPEACSTQINCAPGQYYDTATAQCVYCPSGGYYSAGGNATKCTMCPFGTGTHNTFYLTYFNNDSASLQDIAINRFTTCFGSGCVSGGWRYLYEWIDSGVGNRNSRSVWSFNIPIGMAQKTLTVNFDFNYQCQRSDSIIFSVGGLIRTIRCAGCETKVSQNITIDATNTVVDPTRPVIPVFVVYSKDDATPATLTCGIVRVLNITVVGSSLGGAESCIDCPPGTFADADNNCAPCPAGTFSSNPKAFNCTACAANTFSQAGATTCEPCGTNTFATPGSSKCLPKVVNKLDTSIAGHPRKFDWTAISQATAIATYFPANSNQRVFLNIDLGAVIPHPVCGSSFACSMQGFQRVQSLGDSMDVTPYYQNNRVGLSISSTQFYPMCNRNGTLVKATTSVLMLCAPQVAKPSVMVEMPDPCTAKFTVESRNACPLCEVADYFEYKSECVDGKQTRANISRSAEVIHNCFGGLTLSPDSQVVACSPTIIVEAPVWAILLALAFALVGVICVLAMIALTVFLIIRMRNWRSRFMQLQEVKESGDDTVVRL